MVADDFGILDQMAAHADRLSGQRPEVVLAGLKRLVRTLLISSLPDGTWPDPWLLQDALALAVDCAETSLEQGGLLPGDIDAEDARWLHACRQCSLSIDLFEDMLSDLRAEIPPAGPRSWRP